MALLIHVLPPRLHTQLQSLDPHTGQSLTCGFPPSNGMCGPF